MLITLAKKEVAALDSRLEFIYTASAPFPTKDMETFISLLPHVRLHQGYGSSETGSISNCRYNAPGKTISSLGKPYDCVEVVLEDEEGNLITEAGRPGFIRSRSGMNMLGYYKEPATLLIKTERNALERAMLQFAQYKKNTVRISDDLYKCEIFYNETSETELLIEVLSFGSAVEVMGSERFKKLFKQRIEKQRELFERQ